MKKTIRLLCLVLAAACMALMMTACDEAPAGGAASPKEAWEQYEAKTGVKAKYYLQTDYDGDGREEAYAITGSSFDYEGRTLSAKIYFVSADGKVEDVLSNAPDGKALCGWLASNTELSYDPEAVYIKEGNKKFIVWELGVRDGQNGSLILGVRGGKSYQPKISGEYCRFAQNVNGTCTAYKATLDCVFKFNAATGEYELVSQTETNQ